MDSNITAHMLAKIDQLREGQRDQTELLRQLLAARSHPERRPEKTGSGLLSRLTKMPLHLQWIAGGVVSWGISSSIASFLAHGGDPLKLIELLLSHLR